MSRESSYSNLIGFPNPLRRVILAPSTNPMANVPSMDSMFEPELPLEEYPEAFGDSDPDLMSLADRAALREECMDEADLSNCALVTKVDVR